MNTTPDPIAPPAPRAISDDFLTIRLPAWLKAALRTQAEAESRTLVGQVLHYVKLGLEGEPPGRKRGKVLFTPKDQTWKT